MNESKATRYQRLKRRAHAAGAVSAALMLTVTAWPPVARRLAQLAGGFAHGLREPAFSIVALGVFVVLVLVLWELAALPAVLYLALRLDREYGRHAAAVEDVLGAQAQATAIALPAALVAGGSVLLSLRVAGPWWWALAAVILALVLAGALRGASGLAARLADVRPMERAGLVRRLADLARRARVPVTRIDEWVVAERAAATAIVTGVGRSRRVLIASEIARHWSEDEIAVVVAHELAHHAHRDLRRALALDVAVLAAALAAADLVTRATGARLHISGPGDLAALPLIALVAGAVWTMATPIRHAQSRRQERRADAFALALTGGADAFGTAIRRLGARHLAEERPSALTRWLYYRHPSVAERLALAESFRAKSASRALHG